MRSNPISPVNANRLYLITLALLTSFGIALQAWSTIWGLIITELLIILVPALLFLRTYHLPVVKTTNWVWPNLQISIASLLVGLGSSLIAIRFSQFISLILGYDILPTPNSLPQNFNQVLLLILGYLVLAPVCEEFLFRGVLLAAYKSMGFWTGIIISGLLFAMFHLSLIKLLVLFPIAILLGYIALRTKSLQASILTHLAYNLPATLLLILQGIQPKLHLDWIASAPILGFASLLVIAGLWRIQHTTSHIERSPAVAPNEFWFNWAWPILVSSLFFIFFAGMEFVQARYPELIAQRLPPMNANQWMLTQEWHYELWNILDEPVGTAHCGRQMLEEAITLTCQVDLKPFEAKTSTSYFKSDGYHSQSRFEWDPASLQLVGATYTKQGENDLNYQVNLASNELDLNVSAQGLDQSRLDLPADVFLKDELAWRLSGLSFDNQAIYRANLAHPLTWMPSTQTSHPTLEQTVINIRGIEPVTTTTKTVQAWKVTIGKFTAWYGIEAPHDLIRFNNDFVSFVLVDGP